MVLTHSAAHDLLPKHHTSDILPNSVRIRLAYAVFFRLHKQTRMSVTLKIVWDASTQKVAASTLAAVSSLSISSPSNLGPMDVQKPCHQTNVFFHYTTFLYMYDSVAYRSQCIDVSHKR